MAKVIAKTKIKRTTDRMYYVTDGLVHSVPRKGKRGKKRIEAKFPKGSFDYSKNIYFLDKGGNVAAAARKNRRAKKK